MATITVTRGYTFTSGEQVEANDLNLLGQPSATISNIVNADVSASAGISPSKLAGQGYVYVQTLYYTSPGTATFSKASYPWLRAICAKAQGGGGGGGGAAATAANQNALGSNGGGGSYAEKWITDIAGLASSVTVTVGAGGAGGAAGDNAGAIGNNSSFGALCIGEGGAPGIGGPAGTLSATLGYIGNGALGAATGTGDLVVAGSHGQNSYGLNIAAANAAAGGDSFLGVGGSAGPTATGTSGAAGVRGGGGSGGANAQSQATARAGGSGGNGVVILELYA